jgi:hypothetical protein
VTGFIALGVLAVLIGGSILAVALRHSQEQRPRYAAMLIGGMMLTAFGLVIAGFAIAYQHTKPLNLNSTGASAR